MHELGHSSGLALDGSSGYAHGPAFVHRYHCVMNYNFDEMRFSDGTGSGVARDDWG